MSERWRWLPGECEIIGEAPEPPDHRSLRRGTTKYPFAELKVGEVMRVKRTIGSVREAIRRHVQNLPTAKVFKARRIAGGYVTVRRTK